MQVRFGTAIAIGITALTLAACGGGKDPKLIHFKTSGKGPDEFAILPTKPLTAPESYVDLPAPTPGGINVTDPTPEADAVAALGGRPSALTRRGVTSSDQSLIAHAGRYGVAPGIRDRLASEDLEYRRLNNGRILERLFKVNVYYDSYQPFELDQHRELERWRRAGARTPSAPPKLEGE